MELPGLLAVRPGVTAVTGSGGKTTLLRTLGETLAAEGRRVVLCASTKIYPFPGLENLVSPSEKTLRKTLGNRRLLCVGSPVPGTGKLTAPEIPISRLAELADYVLVEADGSAGRPLKAHASHEPVIPPEANQVILIVGASGFGRIVRETVHRPERFCSLTGLGLDALVTVEAVAKVLQAEAAGPPRKVFVNQVEDHTAMTAARRLAELLPCPVYAGALKRRKWVCLS